MVLSKKNILKIFHFFPLQTKNAVNQQFFKIFPKKNFYIVSYLLGRLATYAIDHKDFQDSFNKKAKAQAKANSGLDSEAISVNASRSYL